MRKKIGYHKKTRKKRIIIILQWHWKRAQEKDCYQETPIEVNNM